MNANRLALLGLQLSLVGGFLLVDDGHPFGLFFPFDWVFVLAGLLVTLTSLVFE